MQAKQKLATELPSDILRLLASLAFCFVSLAKQARTLPDLRCELALQAKAPLGKGNSRRCGLLTFRFAALTLPPMATWQNL